MSPDSVIVKYSRHRGSVLYAKFTKCFSKQKKSVKCYYATFSHKK